MFQKPTPEPVMQERPSMPQVPQAHDDVETVVGPSVHVEGDFASEGNILVKGSVSGNVKTSKLLTVENGAQILANVRAGDAHISGSIKGNVYVEERLELTSSAQILGDITCRVLAVEPGAMVEGTVSMGGTPSSGSRSTKTKRQVRRDVEEEETE